MLKSRVYSRVLGHYRIIAALFVLSFIFFASQLPGLKVLVSMIDLVDPGLPSAKDYRQLQSDFDLKNNLQLIFLPKDRSPWSRAHWQEYEFWRKNWAQEDAYVESFFSALDLRRPAVSPGFLSYRRLIDFESADLSPVLETPWEQILTDEEGRSLSVQLRLEDPPPPTKFGTFWPEALGKLFAHLDQSEFELLNVIKVGSSVFTYYAVLGVSHNMLINLLFFLILILVLKLLFGTWKSGLLLATTFFWSGVILHGMMAFFGYSMEVLSSGLFTLVVIACLEDYVFICHEMKRGHALPETLERFFWPSFFTSLTSTLGFGSLMFTDTEILQRFGLWASVGTMLEWMMIFFFLPACVKVFGIGKLVDTKGSSLRWWENLSTYLNRFTPSKRISLVLLSLYVFAALIIPRLGVSDSPLSLFPKDHPISTDYERFKKAYGWEGEASLTFPLEVSEESQEKILALVRSFPNVAKVESYFEVRDYLTSFDDQGYRDAILRDMEGHPVYRRYRGESLSYRHYVYFKDTDLEVLRSDIQDIRKACGVDCKLIGETISYVEFMQKIPRSLIDGLALSVLLVGGVLLSLAYYHRISHPVLFTLGSVWGASVLIILMWIFQLELNFLSCIFVCMMVGMVGDNAIQFLFAESREGPGKGIAYLQTCSLQVGVLLAFSCLFFQFSYFQPPREFSLVLFLSLLVGTFGDIWLTKGLTRNRESI